jgi:hypothetical protein
VCIDTLCAHFPSGHDYGCSDVIPLTFSNELINQIVLALEPALLASSGRSNDFQPAITHFLTMALEGNKISDVRSIASWFEAVREPNMSGATQLSLIRFLPVMEMPVTRTVLGGFTMNDALDQSSHVFCDESSRCQLTVL